MSPETNTTTNITHIMDPSTIGRTGFDPLK